MEPQGLTSSEDAAIREAEASANRGGWEQAIGYADMLITVAERQVQRATNDTPPAATRNAIPTGAATIRGWNAWGNRAEHARR